jgi:hypothetical protein
MAKKSKSDNVVASDATALATTENAGNDIVSFFLAHEHEALMLAEELGLQLVGGSLSDRADRAAEHMNKSQRHMLAAGLLLATLKADAEHGEFTALIEARGFNPKAAQRAMTYAQYIVSQPVDQREKLIKLPHSKVLALASADPEVIEALVESGESIDTLSVRALQEKIRDLEAAVADRDVRLETAEAEANAAKKAAKKDRGAEVPTPIFDVRAEAVAQVEKARLAVDEVNALGRDLTNLVGVEGVYQWVDPTARLAITGLIALQVQIDGVLKQFKDAFDLVDVKPAPMSYLMPVEIEEAAKRFADLLALHQHEKALRDWERQQERPRGKGRPTAKPEAPKTRD